MRILHVSDLHYRLRQFDWLMAAAPAVDAVVIAGDLLDVRSPVALDVQAGSDLDEGDPVLVELEHGAFGDVEGRPAGVAGGGRGEGDVADRVDELV